MDATQPNRSVTGTDNRKRRSSILKSQRPPRTPLSELEFNVATPTDNAKSRRVSFSRRTGVAEFITNEATTTWKTFYEEHNKSLESSGNEPEGKVARPSASAVSKRIFEQQFQDVEFDSINTMKPELSLRNRSINTSLNNIDVTQQLANLECTENGGKLTVPQHNFELTSFTDHHSKLFGDITNPVLSETSGRIDINFSAVQPIGSDEASCNLDYMQKNLQQAQPNVICVCPFKERRNTSQYLEIDLNRTHVPVANDESDMSITETIYNPVNVNEVSKTSISDKSLEKSSTFNKDWIADKENIVLNPYIAPRETDNFAVNKSPDKVLVFDGKRLTIQSEKDDINIIQDRRNCHQALLSDASSGKIPQRKTISVNLNDDLSDFFDDVNVLTRQMKVEEQKQRQIYSEGDMSTTQSLTNKLSQSISNNTRVNVHHDNTGNISTEQALPTNIVITDRPGSNKRHTIVYEDEAGNISMTQALPANILLAKNDAICNKRKTIIYDNDAGNVSITQTLSGHIISTNKAEATSNKRQTIVYEDDAGDISITQALPNNIIIPDGARVISDRRQTIVYEDVAGDISMTQALPGNIILSDKKEAISFKGNTIICDDSTGNISITQALPANIVLSGKAETNNTVYENDNANISIKQTVPHNINLSTKEEMLSNLRQTIVYEDKLGNVSITHPLPTKIILANSAEAVPGKRKTIIFADDEGDVSMTEALPNNIHLLGKREATNDNHKTIIYDDDNVNNVSITQAVPTHVLLPEKIDISSHKRKTIVYENEKSNIATPQSAPTNILTYEKAEIISDKRQAIFCEKDVTNVPIPQVLPMNITLTDKIEMIPEKGLDVDTYISHNLSTNTTLPDKFKSEVDKRKTIVYDNETGNISVTIGVPANVLLADDKRKTIVFEDDAGNVSITQGLSSNILLHNVQKQESNKELRRQTMLSQCAHVSATETIINEVKVGIDSKNITIILEKDNTNKMQESEKRKTIIYDNELANLSIAKPVPTKLLTIEKELLYESNKDVEELLNVTQDTKQSLSYQKFAADHMNQDVVVYQAVTTHSIPKLQSKAPEQGDLMSMEATSKSSFNTSTAEVAKDISHSNQTMKPHMSKEIESIQQENEQQKKMECDNVEVPKASQIEVADEDNNIDNINNVVKSEDTMKKSFLNDLLDMSYASMEGIIEDKKIMVKLEADDQKQQLESEQKIEEPSEQDQILPSDDVENGCKESLFLIIREGDVDTQSINAKESKNSATELVTLKRKQIEGNKSLKFAEEVKEIENRPHLSTSESNFEIVGDLQKKLPELKSVMNEDKKNPLKNRHYETIVSSNLENTIEEQEKREKPIVKYHLDTTINNKSIEHINDTNQLLEAISEFTQHSNDSKDEKPVRPITVKGHIALENKSDPNESRCPSFEPKRRSVVLSMEDLLNNISMAQAYLKKSRLEIEDSDSIEDTMSDATVETNELRRKSVHARNEVVKTLHFEDEDETINDSTAVSDFKLTPLKKTAFGETTYMKENIMKTNVIPSYLKDVSDGIKELMSDLVKPMTDVLPFEAVGLDKSIRKAPSTCSTQIQANLITSSQIDIDVELASNSRSMYDVKRIRSTDMAHKVLSHGLKSPIRPELESPDDIVYLESNGPNRPSLSQTVPDKVLVFDHHNPLNNILLTPTDYSNAHKYNPVKSNETLCGSDRSDTTQISLRRANGTDGTTLSTQYNLTSVQHNMHQSGDECLEKGGGIKNTVSNTSKPLSIDQSTDVCVMEVKEKEVNTVIVMKGNKELLNASSSLTLVDDALVQSTFDVHIESRVQSQENNEIERNKSPVKLIYKLDNVDSTAMSKLESDFTSNDELSESVIHNDKGKKRNYSPRDKHNLDLTPKPYTKMQKMSNSPIRLKRHTSPENRSYPEIDASKISESDTITDAEQYIELKKSPTKKKKSPRKLKTKKPGATVTVQQLITEYHIKAVDHKLNQEILDAFEAHKSDNSEVISGGSSAEVLPGNEQNVPSPEPVSSFTSSNNQKDTSEPRSMSASPSVTGAAVRGRLSATTWQPELADDGGISMRSECDLSVNVVAKIDMLPFMGSPECEWESSGGDMWSFRLLHGRLRLSVRFAHRHNNAPRTHIRADTPVLTIAVDTLRRDESNPVALLCVRYAAQAMRALSGVSGVGGADAGSAGPGLLLAGALPALVTRCAAVTRAALRWGRAMHEARARLAYTLTNDGLLTLKVANIPLRSVWEVSMRVEMVASGAAGVPWPCACDVRVARVLADCDVRDADVRRQCESVRRDWGHVPRTVWKMFKYLKHKSRDDDLLLGI